MTSDRERPGVAFWTTVMVVAVLVAYPLSFGPWCWIVSRRTKETRFVPVPTFFEPLTRCFRAGRLGDALEWYTKLGAADGSFWHADGGLDPEDSSISFGWCWKCPADGLPPSSSQMFRRDEFSR
jgi:hypothetical protein